MTEDYRELMDEARAKPSELDRLRSKLAKAEWLIRELCSHEGAEGFSEYLDHELELYQREFEEEEQLQTVMTRSIPIPGSYREPGDSGFRTKRKDSDMRCQLEVVFSPARPDLDGLGFRADPGGFVYRVRDESGRVRVGGSVRTLDPLAALHCAKYAAAAAGFDSWRSWNAGGAYVALA